MKISENFLYFLFTISSCQVIGRNTDVVEKCKKGLFYGQFRAFLTFDFVGVIVYNKHCHSGGE